jgi:hypothetical protein
MKKNLLLALLATAGLSALAQPASPPPIATPDTEGFIRDWLVLAPFPLAGMAAEEIDFAQFPSEAQPAAKAGATQTIGSRVLTWAKVTTTEFYIDFAKLNPSQSENVAAWAVAYVEAPAELTGLTLRMNSNDQGKVFLNGQTLLRFADTRTLDKTTEDSAANITLKKGINVLVLKVINEENNWQGSVRFLAADGTRVTNLKISTTR